MLALASLVSSGAKAEIDRAASAVSALAFSHSLGQKQK